MRASRWLALMGLALVGCGGDDPAAQSEPAPEEESGVIVAPGKEDNFLSPSAQEYMVEGTTTVTIESYLAAATPEEKLARVQQLIPLKQVVIGWFLNAYLVEKSGDEPNSQYGGFSALTKNGAYEELNIEPIDDRTYQFTFRQEFGGKLDLLTQLPTTVGDDGRRYFDLTIGKISNNEMAQLETNNEWYRRSPWSEFDPGKVDASRLETVRLAVWPEPRSSDAWFDYNRLMADGKVTIGVHYGWDYHSDYHLKHSRDVYSWLVGQGFKSPVPSWDQLKRDSGPLTKTIDVRGKPVVIEVSLYFGKPGTEADPDTDAGGRVLEADMRRSFAEREVIIYSGHSGPFYGFALANWRKTAEGDLDDSEIADMTMPADVYQVVVAEGCDTYGLGQAFRMNPAKAGAKNIDVITTTSFSNASTSAAVKDSLRAIFGTNSAGQHEPVTMLQYLRDMDSNSMWFNTMYGVHGLDDNPHAHPYAQSEMLCKPCSTDADCGGTGNKCTRLNSKEKFCTYVCTAHDGCPEGFQCMAVATGSSISSSQCAPKNMTCEAPPPEPQGPALIINEVFASPKASGGDANGDQISSTVDDEFIELVNISGRALDLAGMQITDSVMTRFSFPAGSVLAPGKAALVFGGGQEASFSSLGGSLVFVAGPSRLGLNNTGDQITLVAPQGEQLDQMTYGAEGGKGRSLVRERDADPSAPFVQHPGSTHSAGVRSDGSVF